MFSRKIRHVAIRSGAIRWISIRFDADISNYEFVSSSNKSLKYQSFIPSGGKVIVIRKFEFVAKTLLLDHLTTSILNFNDVIWDIALVG